MSRAANTSQVPPRPERPRERGNARASRARGSSVIEREAARAEQVWLNFKTLREAASTPRLGEAGASSLSQRAWDLVQQADPVRVSFAAAQLGLSDTAVRTWIDAGALEPVPANGSGPLRITMASVVAAAEIIDELRALGEDRNLVQLVLARIEGKELAGDERFRRSLDQMDRGQRGEWPRGF